MIDRIKYKRWARTVASSLHLTAASMGVMLLLTLFVTAAGSYQALNLASDVPHIDDWHFISDLEEFHEGLSVQPYVFKRHNGHPSVPARAAFLLSAEYFNLDLRHLRYGTYLIFLACYVLLVLLITMVWRDQNAPIVLPITVTAFCALVIFSPNHWETYSLAMGITNITATAAVIGSVVAGYWWICGKGVGFLAISFSSALLATASMTQGMFAWTALTVLFLVGNARCKIPLAALCCAIQLLALLWNYFGHAGAAGASQPLDALKFALMIPILVSSPSFGMISNTPFVPLSIISGVVISAICAIGFASVQSASTANRKSMAPFLALLCYGALTIFIIAIGRRDMPVELIAAPRYAALTMPFLIGAFGVLSIAATKKGVATACLGGIFALCLTGWLVSAQQEYALLEARRATVAHIKQYLLSRSFYEDDDQSLREKLYIDGNTLEIAKQSIRFIKKQQMSIFSVPGLPGKTQSGQDAAVPAHSQ